MKHKIEHRKSIFRSGTNVYITLDFTDEERRIIRDNNMEAITIVEIEPDTKIIVDRKTGKSEKVAIDNNIYFRDLYRRRTSYHCDSVIEANDLHKKLFQGLRQLEVYLEANKAPAEDTEGDFKIKIPEFSADLIPDYMWPQHFYVLAESGGGKTQLLQTIYLQQMRKEKPPGVIIIDSQNQMPGIIKARFPDALMIHPTKNPITLDLFNTTQFDTSVHSTIDTFRYLFESGGQELTGRQQTAFVRAIALMLVGWPKAYARPATLDDFEDYLTGRKKGKELPPNAHRAVDAMPEEERNWYYHQYAGFDESHAQILQRLNNICGPYTPLRPLFKRQHHSINLYDAIENGRTILVNTDYEALGRYGSAFFGRFFLKLLDKTIAHRHGKSRSLILMIDEAQEYFDGGIMKNYPDQARKRNVSVIWSNQRLAQLPQDLRDALLGVGTLVATNVNEADIREVSNRFRVELDQVRAWRPEFRGKARPTYTDFGYLVKGRHAADTFRLKYGQLEDLPKKSSRTEEARERADGERPKDRPHTDAPIDDTKYDDRFDMEWFTPPQHPRKVREGYVLMVKCPNGREHPLPIPAGTRNGARFCIKGMSRVRRPDGSFGNFWVQLTVPEFEEQTAEERRNEEPKQERKKGR